MKPKYTAILFLLLLVTGCSILKNDDPQKEVQAFLSDFQANLSKSDDEVMTYFQVKQSREAVLSVINILRNSDPYIVCEAPLTNASVSIENDLVKVEVPTTFNVKNLDSEDSETSTLTFWLSLRNKKYVITELDGEPFYQAFSMVKNRNEWEAERKTSMQERLWVYENARKLEPAYDSVIWYSTQGDQTYFYVVQGSWTNYFLQYSTRKQKNQGVKMGLVTKTGEPIIPIEYDLIGSIGFVQPNFVEVRKEGKVGFFDIDAKQLRVEPIYDIIIPYERGDVWAITKQDSTYGWLTEDFKYNPGFPSEQAKQWIMDFEFLKAPVRLKPDVKNFCEIPNPEYAGNGIIVPPAYLSKYGIFEEVEGGISTTKVPLNGWTDYIETTKSFIERIGDNMQAIVTTVRERYLEGREEFYTRNNLIFINEKSDTLNVLTVAGDELSIHKTDSSMLEVRTPFDQWIWEYDVCEENNLLSFSYFSIDKSGSVKALPSQRIFEQTQYVKLDSSYLTGKFEVYNRDSKEYESRNFLSVKTITYMRDEILASYGYSFPGTERSKLFQDIANWYKPTHDSLEEFKNELTPIDAYNLEFLNKILANLQPLPAS